MSKHTFGVLARTSIAAIFHAAFANGVTIGNNRDGFGRRQSPRGIYPRAPKSRNRIPHQGAQECARRMDPTTAAYKVGGGLGHRWESFR